MPHRSQYRPPDSRPFRTDIAIPALLLIVFLAAGCGSQEATRTTAVRPSDQRASVFNGFRPDTSLVAVGDSIVFTVWGFPEFNTRAIVKPTGTITVPMIGEQLSAGNRPEEIAAQLKVRLSEYIKGEIRLSLEVSHPPPRITVLGSVARAGSFPTEVDLSLLEALASVGGWTDEADLRYIRINRLVPSKDEAPALEINLQGSMESGDIRSIPVVHPGDVIIVPRKENPVRQASDFLRDALFLLGLFRIFN